MLTSMNFNPRSREGSDRNGDAAIPAVAAFQSSLPRGERLLSRVTERLSNNVISILAPARGATPTSCKLSVTPVLFQSSLPRGERLSHHPSPLMYR